MNSTARPASVIPLRYVASVDSLRDFYMEQLGFDHLMGMVGKDGQLDFAIVQGEKFGIWGGMSERERRRVRRQRTVARKTA